MKPDTGTRLYVEAPLSPSAVVEIGADRAHYLRDVLRLRPGAALRLFNGRDGEWRAAIGKLTKSGGTLAVEAQTRPQSPAPDLWLVFAPPSGPPSIWSPRRRQSWASSGCNR